MADPLPEQERRVVRELAQRYADIAAEPIQAERIALWKRFNALDSVRPMVLSFPEGGWPELIHPSEMQCQDPRLKGVEWQLRARIFHHERIADDHPWTNVWHVGVVVRYGDFGLAETRQQTDPKGAWHWEPPLKDPADVKKLHPRTCEVDWDQTEVNRQFFQELFGDILDVRVDNSPRINLHFPKQLIMFRGDEQVMLDMYDEPEMLHDILAILTESAQNELDVLIREGALRLNNKPDDYCGTGGIGCTDELPAEGFDGTVRPCDTWALGESQEYASVSPEQYDQFSVKYHAKLLNQAGLSYYGCCEALHHMFDVLKERITNLRALSISPWCDTRIAAEKLQDQYLLYWKPNPALTAGIDSNWPAVEELIRDTLQVTRGCHLAMVLKDTHTFGSDPNRPGDWVKVARRCIEEAAETAV